MKDSTWLEGCLSVLSLHDPQRCTVAPSPTLSEKIKSELERVSATKRMLALPTSVRLGMPKSPGLNDGLIIPGSHFPVGTSLQRVRSAAADRSPLHGTVRVVVVLVDFDDKPMTETREHFEDLFFSTGVMADGSVKEYFDEVTNGLVSLTGEVVGPYRMPQSLADYANGASGTGSAAPNARTMARDAAVAADPDVNFAPYDNDANGFVDAFVVVHAGAGAEETGSTDDIWSHKWVLSGGALATDGTEIYGYLTVPEDSRIGVCAHELGHLLFGFPDLYDTDNTSEGIGRWCLMAGGSWNSNGDVPAHPSAWCKVQQDWVTVQNVTSSGPLTIPDVKDSHTVFRMWKDGAAGQEYFLVENRQRSAFDAHLPGDGLLVWHIDDAMANNTDESHYRVALEQADGNRDMENNTNRGDDGDPFPGSTGNRSFNATSDPSSKSYAGVSTCVSLSSISDSAPVMTAQAAVACGKSRAKDVKDAKDGRKDTKELRKEWVKEIEHKRYGKDHPDKRWVGEKRPEKPDIDKRVQWEKPFDKRVEGKYLDGPYDRWAAAAAPAESTPAESTLAERVAYLESIVLGQEEPFIDQELRPDLRDSALSEEPDTGGRPETLADKRSFDSPPGSA